MTSAARAAGCPLDAQGAQAQRPVAGFIWHEAFAWPHVPPHVVPGSPPSQPGRQKQDDWYA